MAIGGYVVIDLKGADITTSGVTVPGIYEQIESATGRKPILLRNFSISGIDKIPVFSIPSTFVPGGGHASSYFLSFAVVEGAIQGITVRDDNLISWRNY